MGRVAPSVIPANGTQPALTKGEVTVGGCSGGKIPSPPHVPKGREAVVSVHHGHGRVNFRDVPHCVTSSV